ncbi:hypothetical protein EV401DRAFT_1147009 [Pisolithus croceorrhizus]|nr:hypothetical protein EV401DRAFT_1147009 [Pisolithus croceorrhizus]
MYHHQQGGSSYDYPSYPAQPFEHQGQPTQTLGRTIRQGNSQTHSPQNPQNFQPPTTYASTTYATPPYNISSAHPQQWQAEPWATQQYGQTFASQAVPTEMPYSSAAPRIDPPTPVSSQEARFSSSSLSQAQELRRPDSGYTAPAPTSPPPRNRRKDKESPMMPPAQSPPSGLDYNKMAESYRLILDKGNHLLSSGAFTQSQSPPAEPLERMTQSASYGMQMLRSALAQSNPEFKPTSGVPDRDTPASKRQKSDENAQEGQTCLGCQATSTPEWRRGPLGPRTLCNACGLVYAKLLKKRARGETRSHAQDSVGQSTQPAIDESGIVSSGASEDEDSYGSQERRSDFGDHARRG